MIQTLDKAEPKTLYRLAKSLMLPTNNYYYCTVIPLKISVYMKIGIFN
jgi:hypothetical protein